jgi:serine/threonine-protein kinase HipA
MRESQIVRDAEVYWGDALAGVIEQTPREATFRYNADFPATPLPGGGIGLNLPRDGGPFATPGAWQHTFFANLLPEGFRLNAVRSRLKTSGDDALSILLEVGANCVGNVAVVPPEQKPVALQAEFQANEVTELDLMELLSRDVMGNESLPGVQEKLSDQMISFPAKSRPTAAIVKLSPPAYPLLVANEHFFMKMAAECGLRVAETQMLIDRTGRQALLVKRFDRSANGKLAQEDACQLLDIYPGAKYNVSMRDVAASVARFGSGGPIQLRRLLQLVAYSYLIGNGDLHAKNVSLYRTEAGLIELTPAYDLLSTLPYQGLDQHMALMVDGKNDNLKGAFLCRFFESVGLPERASRSILQEICDRSTASIERLAEIGYDAKRTTTLLRKILLRRDHLGAS